MKKIIASLVFVLAVVWMSAQNTSISYFDNGNIMTTYYVHGNYAERITYYEDGAVKEYATFLNSKPHGNWKLYNENGKIVSQGMYQNGKKTGVWKVWNGDATGMIEVTYKDNLLINTTDWATGKH